MAEEPVEAFLADTEQACQVAGVEAGLQVLTVLFQLEFNQSEQLAVVLEVGITLAFDVAFHQLSCHFGPSAHTRTASG